MTLDPQMLLYAKTHEWVHVENDPRAKIATVGLSDFALKALTDLVHIELPARRPRGRRGHSAGRGRVGQGRQRHLQPGGRRDRRGQRGAGRATSTCSRRTPTAPAGW